MRKRATTNTITGTTAGTITGAYGRLWPSRLHFALAAGVEAHDQLQVGSMVDDRFGGLGPTLGQVNQPVVDLGPAGPIKKKRPERRLFPCRLAEQAGFEPAEGY